jgi:RHS repeat-associated protein
VVCKGCANASHAYDGDGNRLEKSSGKIYWYGAGTEILDETDASGNLSNEYVYFGGKRISWRTTSGGAIYYYEGDMLGSSRTMVQAGQTSVCYDADFYPFGGERDIVSTCTQHYKFEGKEQDTETGNDDFGARYYTSRLGRWLSADWSSVPAPVPYANLTNPQTLNLYAMVSDNPEAFADLDGHVSEDGGPYNLETGDSSQGSDGQGHQCDYNGGDCSKKATQGAAKTQAAQTKSTNKQSWWQRLTASLNAAYGAVVKTYQTYTKTNPETGKVYSGRTSGANTPEANVAARDQNHHMNEQGYGPAQVDKSSSSPDAIRGREQQLIEANGGAQSEGGTSGNAINGISPRNPNAGILQKCGKR